MSLPDYTVHFGAKEPTPAAVDENVADEVSPETNLDKVVETQGENLNHEKDETADVNADKKTMRHATKLQRNLKKKVQRMDLRVITR